MGKTLFALLCGVVIGAAAFGTEQFFFELNGGIYFYPGLGGKIGWMH